MNRQRVRTFLDTNVLIFAENYRKANVFDWIDRLYHDVWIHIDVMNELLLGKARIEREVRKHAWSLFDPEGLPDDERQLYALHIQNIEAAFQRMNWDRAIADFCTHCVRDAGIERPQVRRLYKTIFEDKALRERKLAEWDRQFLI